MAAQADHLERAGSSVSFLINEYYVAPRYDAAAKEDRDKRHHHVQEYKQKEEAKAVELKAALERIVGLIDTLDGNVQTQEALSEAVAQEEAIGEVWVTNAQGLIVYYGRHIPPVRNVADFPLGSLTKILNMVPEDVISPIQRTAILLPTIIGGHWYRVSLFIFLFKCRHRHNPKAPNHFYGRTLYNIRR